MSKLYQLIRKSEWREEVTRCATGESVSCIYRRTPGHLQWEPWVIVAPSALLQSIGFEGLGLYAARAFKRDDVVGRYDGTVIDTSVESVDISKRIGELVLQGHDKLLLRRNEQKQMEIVDGATSGPPYLMRCNDPRGSRYKPNTRYTDGGYMRISQSRVKAFDMSKSVQDNIVSELRVDYGSDYWQCW